MERLDEARGRDPGVAAVVAGSGDHEQLVAGVARERLGRLRGRGAGALHERHAVRGGACFDRTQLGEREDRCHATGWSTVSRASGSVCG